MTMDEAIALVKIERECVIRADVCDRKCEKCDLLQDSTKLTDMYEQLAEWLELLKWYEQGMEDIPCESGVLPKDVYHAGYEKAIDDFVKEICKMIVQSENNGNYRFYAVEIKQAIADLAEQLKAGGENEQGI